ncbi:hypothetical protein LUZ60_001328 [Juncus effusus]|nr:hypothetical protein LUZ60_001328 [Juncus effusus]
MDSPSPSPDPSETRLSTTSLFPIFPVSSSSSAPSLPPSTSSHNPQWLSNSSFTVDVSTLPSAPPHSSSSDDEPEPEPVKPQQKKYDFVQSGSDSEDGRKERKKRRKKERGADKDLRKSGVRAWSGRDKKQPVKDYYFDAKGDRDNLAFGSLYKMDIARYRIETQMGSSNHKFLSQFKQSSNIYEDSDLDQLDSKSKSNGRYFSIKYSNLERNKGFKHLKITHHKDAPSTESDEYIPLEEKDSDSSEEQEESWEDEIIKKTRDFNKKSREFPHDEQVWLAFAEFQDKIAKTQRQKAARLQIIEKKISILEKSIELNPGNENLIICLLNTYKERDSTENVLAKWENILTEYSDNIKLWKEYLNFCQGDFSRFKVSEIRKCFAYAVRAISSCLFKLSRQESEQLVKLEVGLVEVFVKLCMFEWQTGHRELASGLFQAQIEYSLFSPILNLNPNSKKRLFGHFWNSGGARVGEDGAVGWSTWLTKDEEENLHKNIPSQEREEEETEVGGWTGWVDFDSRSKADEEGKKESDVEDGNDENAPEGNDNEDEDVETLLKKLGIDVDSESNSEVKNVEVWHKWSEEEICRDNKQWMPVRENTGGDEEEEQLTRVILFDDVADYLFSLNSEEARFSLICQFINFFSGKISQWTCTNNSTWLDQIMSLEFLPNQISQDIKLANETRSSNFEYILDASTEFPTDINMIKFLKKSVLLFLEIFPRNYILQETLLSIEDLFPDSSSRPLAKTLLKKDRQDILFCGVYAKTEAANGNIDMARKIFDMALVSADSAPKDLQDKSALLYLWYAESEINHHHATTSSDSSLDRALHILSHQVSSSAKYTPFASPLSSLQILRARQGFKDRIKGLTSRGLVGENSVAFVCSACLFEVLSSGLSSGLEVLQQAFSFVLPERRSYSLELEKLWVYYVGLIMKNVKRVSFFRVWKNVNQGLQIYPFNPKLFSVMLNLSGLYSVSNKVRLILDKYTQRNPSVILYIFAISFEWGRDGSHNRIHGLFERALSNEKLQKSVLLWRLYIDYEINIVCNPSSARRVFFRAIHACPWSKKLWLDGFRKLSSILTLKELSDLQEVMRDKELNIRTDIYEILLQDEMES